MFAVQIISEAICSLRGVGVNSKRITFGCDFFGRYCIYLNRDYKPLKMTEILQDLKENCRTGYFQSTCEEHVPSIEALVCLVCPKKIL